MAKTLEDIDRTRIEPTALDAREVRVCGVLNEPDMTFLRALKVANRIEEPEKVIRYYRAALETREESAAHAFLHRLCRLLDEDPDVLVREFGGAFLLEAWAEEEKVLLEMMMERIRCQSPGIPWKERDRKDIFKRGRLQEGARRVSVVEVIDILEDLALRYAEKAYSESTIGNPRGMRQDLWKSKGIFEASDMLRRMFGF